MKAGRRNRPSLIVGLTVVLVAVVLLAWGKVADAAVGLAVTDPHDGFAFALPSNWKIVPLDGGDITSLLNAATHDDPALTNALSGEVTAAASKKMKLFAIGPVDGLAVPNVNVIVTPSGGAPTGFAFSSAAVAEAKIELTESSASHIRTRVLKNRLGSTAEATYQLDLPNASTQYGEQFYAIHKTRIYIVTVTTPNGLSTELVGHSITASWSW